VAGEPTTTVVPDRADTRRHRAAIVTLLGLVPVVIALVLLFARARGPVVTGTPAARVGAAAAAPTTTLPAVARESQPTTPTTPPRATATPTPASLPPSTQDAAEDDATATPADVSGRWAVDNEIETSEHAPYRGLRLGYEVTLRQRGRRVSGDGRKVSENGAVLPAPRQTPIIITGRTRGRLLELSFMEQGAERNASGTMRWQLSGDGSTIAGTFASDVAASRGSSRARRLAAVSSR
jgi:hypothetical protein